MKNPFDLTGKVAVITGGAGFLGKHHAEAIASFGGTPVLLDLSQSAVDAACRNLNERYHTGSRGFAVDITNEEQVSSACQRILDAAGKIDILINNAANNPTVDASSTVKNASRLENFPMDIWNQDIAVGLTGSFLCSKHFGRIMAQAGSGSIINISSDLGVIAPDQRLYRKEGVSEDQQNVKPVTYSVVKTGLIGLTRYLATYWADKGVRCNALCPGGVQQGQGADFLMKIQKLIPLDRMARPDEYEGAIVFLASDASSYMNGAILIMDGGRSAW